MISANIRVLYKQYKSVYGPFTKTRTTNHHQKEFKKKKERRKEEKKEEKGKKRSGFELPRLLRRFI